MLGQCSRVLRRRAHVGGAPLVNGAPGHLDGSVRVEPLQFFSAGPVSHGLGEISATEAIPRPSNLHLDRHMRGWLARARADSIETAAGEAEGRGGSATLVVCPSFLA